MAVVAVLLFVLIVRSGAFSSSSSASATTHRITKSPHISNAIHRRSNNDGRRERRRWLDETNDDESSGMLDGENVQAVSISRRRRLAIVSACASTYLLLVSVGGPTASAAPPTIDINDDDDREFVRGRITLQSPSLLDDIITSSVSEKTNDSSYALYVTARPSIPDNVPTAILDGSRGKSPPVLSARYPNPTFPFDFALTAKDFTTEGAAKIVNGDSASDKHVWWSGQDLIVSARLDTDGIASTRDPTDLVGRGIFHAHSISDIISIQLSGRGMFGKRVTSKTNR
jgi:hypothetical protein